MGFACQHLWTTPEEVGELQPLIGRSGAMLVMDGRIDNRDELLGALGLPSTVSDAACVLAAYEAWHERFVERLNGDFAIAVFDASRSQLVLARDPIGVRPLYYFRNASFFAFASEIKALLAHPEVPRRPDDDGLADFLLLGCRPMDRLDATCFAEIAAVVPAHTVIVTPDRLVARRYWDFDRHRAIRLRSFDEYAEAFRERFREAVRRRIRSHRAVSISVSGGLDSSSIYCQAVALQRSGAAPCPRIHGISYGGTGWGQTDERQYLLDIEREYGVEIERFPIEPLVGLIQGTDEQIGAIEAPFLDYMWGVSGELRRRVAARGSRVLLSGHWGDQMLFSSAYLVDLVNRLAWREAWRHTREYARWLGAAEVRDLTRRFAVDLVRHHTPAGVLPALKWIRRCLFGTVRETRALSNAFLQRGLDLTRRSAIVADGFHSAQARSIYLEARSKYHVHSMDWNNKVGALHGIDAAFPFLDRDLIAFLMAIPGEIQNRNGVPRALLREAMRGILPEAVRARTWKADFSDFVNDGVAQDASAMARALGTQSLAVRRGYLDAERLGSELTRLSGDLRRPDCVNSWHFADLFGLETWLQVFFPAGVATPTPRSLSSQEDMNDSQERRAARHQETALPNTDADHAWRSEDADQGQGQHQ